LGLAWVWLGEIDGSALDAFDLTNELDGSSCEFGSTAGVVDTDLGFVAFHGVEFAATSTDHGVMEKHTISWISEGNLFVGEVPP